MRRVITLLAIVVLGMGLLVACNPSPSAPPPDPEPPTTTPDPDPDPEPPMMTDLDLTLEGWERATANGFTWMIEVEDSETDKANQSLNLVFAIDRNNVDVSVADGGTEVCGWADDSPLAVEVSGTTVSFKGTVPASPDGDCTGIFTDFAFEEGDTASFELNLANVPDTTPVAKAAPQKEVVREN